MKKRKAKTLAVVACTAMVVGLVGCCSPREAATVGAMIGRPFGYALGTGAVAIEETFETAKDVRQANPRYDGRVARPCGPYRAGCGPACGTCRPVDDTHYYEATVLVKTTGPASIQSIDFKDSEDVTAFWN